MISDRLRQMIELEIKQIVSPRRDGAFNDTSLSLSAHAIMETLSRH